MSIAGGLFNSNNKQENTGDTKSTADGDATSGMEEPRDLTTSLPGFDDPVLDEDSIVLGTDTDEVAFEINHDGQVGNQDIEGLADDATLASYDVDAEPEVPLDPES